MFALSNPDSSRAELTGHTVRLVVPCAADHAEWARARGDSHAFLQPWEPMWAPNDLSRYAFRQRLQRYARERRAGTAEPYFLRHQKTGSLIGGITLAHIKRGVSQSAQIGYWMAEAHAGQGHMSEAVRLMCSYAFTRCGLHRLEAACIPDNTRSIRLLERAGFTFEGQLKGYLKINGQWRDHVLYARINPYDDLQT